MPICSHYAWTGRQGATTLQVPDTAGINICVPGHNHVSSQNRAQWVQLEGHNYSCTEYPNIHFSCKMITRLLTSACIKQQTLRLYIYN